MRRIRLDPDAYKEGHAFLVTIAVSDRYRLFNRDDAAKIALTAMAESSDKYGAEVFAYCLMPDHIHLLVRVPSRASLMDFVRHFKQLSAFRIKQLAGRPVAVWQKRFHDHALRSEESLEDVATYIWHNPVRAGLVSDPREYAYSGSLVWEDMPLGPSDPNLRFDEPPAVVASSSTQGGLA